MPSQLHCLAARYSDWDARPRVILLTDVGLAERRTSLSYVRMSSGEALFVANCRFGLAEKRMANL